MFSGRSTRLLADDCGIVTCCSPAVSHCFSGCLQSVIRWIGCCWAAGARCWGYAAGGGGETQGRVRRGRGGWDVGVGSALHRPGDIHEPLNASGDATPNLPLRPIRPCLSEPAPTSHRRPCLSEPAPTSHPPLRPIRANVDSSVQSEALRCMAMVQSARYREGG